MRRTDLHLVVRIDSASQDKAPAYLESHLDEPVSLELWGANGRTVAHGLLHDLAQHAGFWAGSSLLVVGG